MSSKRYHENQRDQHTAKSADRRDTLFSAPIGEVSGFSFNEEVAAVFPDMLRRSIPGYQAIITQTGLLGARFAQPQTQCYDLGCSLGATTLSLRHNIPGNCRLVAVDNSSAMMNKLSGVLHTQSADTQALCPVELRCEDILDTPINHASVVALNFTLQFIDSDHREALLQQIYAGMTRDSILILSEKVIFEDAAVNQLYIDMYHDFKRANGYSELEISQKRTALENVLVPDTLETHRQRLSKAGFRHSSVWFQCFNFLSLIAFK